SPEWGEPPSWPKERASYLASDNEPRDAKEGAKVFQRACVLCHNEEGRGFKKDDKMVNAINDAAFLALLSDRALRRIVITGRSDLGMPGYQDRDQSRGGELSNKDISNVVAYVASWRQRVRAASRQEKK